MKPKSITGVECPECSAFIEVKGIQLETRYRCKECDEVYIDEDEAKECCGEEDSSSSDT